MRIDQVAVITFTIRDFIKTPDAFRESMAKLSSIGYKAVQISGMPQDILTEEEIAKICSDNGLTICATHEPGDKILNEPSSVIERLQRLGVKYTAYPFPAGIDFTDRDACAKFIQQLDSAGEKFQAAGLTLTYHNHANEFYRYDGKAVLEHIYDGTSADNLQAEIDTYWVQLGGGCPVQWCKRLNGRLPLLHLKDVGVRAGNEPTMFEIGSGNLDFKSIIPAAEESGCKWFILEQDTCPGDPFDSLTQSYQYIESNLVSE